MPLFGLLLSYGPPPLYTAVPEELFYAKTNCDFILGIITFLLLLIAYLDVSGENSPPPVWLTREGDRSGRRNCVGEATILVCFFFFILCGDLTLRHLDI